MAAIVTEDGNWSNDRLMGQTFNIQRARLYRGRWNNVTSNNGSRGDGVKKVAAGAVLSLPRGQEATIGQGKGEEQLKGLNGTWTNVKRGTFIENMLAKCTRMLLPIGVNWCRLHRLSCRLVSPATDSDSYCQSVSHVIWISLFCLFKQLLLTL